MKEKEKEKKLVKFESLCDGHTSVKIHNANIAEVLASIGCFINHVYTHVCDDKVSKQAFKFMFEKSVEDGIFFEDDEDKPAEKKSEIELDDLKILADLLKGLTDK